MLSEDGMVSSTDLLRTVPTLERKLTHNDAQTFLKSLVRDKWFKEQVSRTNAHHLSPFQTSLPPSQSPGVLSPGPRFILELRPFLQELFGEEVLCCRICKEPAIQVKHVTTKSHKA